MKSMQVSVRRPLLVVGCVAFIAAVAMIFIVFRQQGFVKNAGDPYGYGAIAHGFVDHGFVKLTRRAASLYPELIAVVYRLGGSDLLVQLLQAGFHVGTCLLAVTIGTRLYNPRTGLIAGLLCTLHPMLLRYVADLHMETMLTFLCTLTFWRAIVFHGTPTIRNGLILGALGMVTTLTKGVVLPFVVIFAGIELVLAVRPVQRGRVYAVASILVAMAVVVAPWSYRNYRVTDGRFMGLTPGTSDSFLRGYIFTRLEFATLQKPPYTFAENESNAWFRSIARDNGVQWEADELVDEQNNKRVAKQMIAQHPLDTVRKCVVGLFTFWYEMTSLKNSLIPAVLAIGAWALAWVGWRRARVEGISTTWLLVVPIVVMNVLVAVLIPLGRYSVPILPCLMVLASFGVDTLLIRRSSAHSPALSSDTA
jgi:4-amino-4-deoxy-L-arabinose transferase-like glycosyltransferase